MFSEEILFMRRWWRGLMRQVFPIACVGCGEEGDFLCESCVSMLRKVPNPGPGGPVNGQSLDGLVVCYDYKSVPLVQKSLHLLKYSFIQDLAVPLGKIMAERMPQQLGLVRGRGPKGEDQDGTHDDLVVMCPVPLHERRRRWRGFNQAELLAREVAVATDLPVRQLLQRRRFVKPQMELSRTERIHHMRDAFVAAPQAAGAAGLPREVILIDDVATTLATLDACGAALKQAGVQKVYGFALARSNLV